MRVLVLHNNFPAQYRHIVTYLGRHPDHQVVFGTQNVKTAIPGVIRGRIKPTREPHDNTHPYLRSAESAVLAGQAAYRLGQALERRGFVPDIVCGHSGWGPTLYMKEKFPEAKLLCYFEWYYQSHGTDVEFLPNADLSDHNICRIRSTNIPILMDLAACDWGISPTRWQASRFPELFRHKISVLHDGVDVDFFAPEEGTKLTLPDLDLSDASEIVTYATRGMEPYRGFPQFMRAAALVQKRRPGCHIVVVGEDRVAYGRRLPKGQSYKQKMLDELDFDPKRLHFTGLLPYSQYRQVLRASSAHVYLTVPFVLSWSMLEAMATGCLVVTSGTEPVLEVVEDGKNAIVVDFFDHEALAERIEHVLRRPDAFRALRAAARRTIEARYALKDLLPRQIQLIEDVAEGRIPPGEGPASL